MSKSKRILKAVLPTILVLIVAEVALRITHAATNRDEESVETDEWWDFAPGVGWALRPNFAGEVYGSQRTFDDNGYLSVDSDEITGGSRPRIMLIGDSSTFGNGVAETETYGEVLEELLGDCDVVNLGVPGYTSLQGRVVLEREIKRLEPRLIVVSFSFNDRRYVLQKEDIDSEERFKQIYRAGHGPKIARLSYIVRYLYKLRQSGVVVGDQVSTKSVHVTKVLPRVHPEQYRKNLRDMIKIARDQDVGIVFLALPDNPAETQLLRRSVQLYQRSQFKDAFENLIELASTESVFAPLAKRIMTGILHTSERPNEAEAVGQIENPIISLHGGEPIYMDIEYKEVMREVAVGYQVPFVDAELGLSAHPEYFIDFSHFDATGHRVVAELLERSIELNGLLKEN